MSFRQRLENKVMERADLRKEQSDEEIMELIHEVILEENKQCYIPLEKRTTLATEIFNGLRKLDILQEYIEDSGITEIMVNGRDFIFVEEQGRIRRVPGSFSSQEKLEDIVQQIVSESNRVVNEALPIADARLKNGSRVSVVLPPVALDGPIITIRRFPENPIRIKDLLRFGSVTEECVRFLEKLVAARYNIFISGGTGSGKTTFLNALTEYIPKDERIITIEDNAELQITDVPNLVRLEARNGVDIRELIRASLRMRPDRIIVGEVRGGEALDMLQAMNTGHEGSIGTGHASSPEDMLSRLETMVLMGMELPVSAIRRQIASGIDLIVQLGRLRDKSRKVLKVAEVIGYEQGEIILNTIYEFKETGEEHGQIKGNLKQISELSHREKLYEAGITI